MKLRNVVLMLVLTIGVLAGCGGTTPAATSQPAGAVAPAGAAAPADTETAAGPEDSSNSTAQLDMSYEGALSLANQLALGTFLLEETALAVTPSTNTDAQLDMSYEGALSLANQLALGTFLLEETSLAVTPQQAKAVLPLWQAIQGGTLQSSAETDAVLGQIERAMTSEQVAAIAAKGLTNEDLQVWAQETGVDLGPSPEAIAARQADGTAQGDFAKFSDMSEEDRAAARATAQASGLGGPGQGGDMSAEDREARRATAEASGMSFAGRGVAGQLASLAGPLVELLTERSAG